MYKYGLVKALPKDVEETREVEFIISSEAKDRYGDRLLIDRWDLKNYNSNGVVGYQHEVWGFGICNPPDPDYMMGPGKAWIEDKFLVGSVKFEPKNVNELAEKIFQKVLHGTLKAASVGVLETNKEDGYIDEKDGAYVFGGQELLEWSIVNIPANQEAIRRHFTKNFDNALNYLDKVLGDKYSMEELKEMKVKHIIEAMKGNFHNEEEEEEVKDTLQKLGRGNPANALKLYSEKMARGYF